MRSQEMPKVVSTKFSHNDSGIARIDRHFTPKWIMLQYSRYCNVRFSVCVRNFLGQTGKPLLLYLSCVRSRLHTCEYVCVLYSNGSRMKTKRRGIVSVQWEMVLKGGERNKSTKVRGYIQNLQ